MMKRILAVLAVLALNISAFAQVDRSKRPEPGPARPIEIGSYETFTLKNGLKVIVVENNKLPRVNFSLVLNITPVSEGDKVGYVEMTGDLLRRGTTSRTKDQLDEEIDFMGASLGTYSSGAYASCLSKYTEKTLELLSDVVLHPSFPEDELAKIIKESRSGLASLEDDPGAMMSNLSLRRLYGTAHPYGEIQKEEHLDNISVADCRSYYSAYFRPNVAYLAVVGNIKAKTAKKLVKKYFGEWESAEVPAAVPAFPELPAQTEISMVHRASSVQSMLQLSNVASIKPGQEDLVTISVMNQVLGGGSAARLFKNLREDKAFTYGAYSNYDTDPFAGSFTAEAEVRNAVTRDAVVEFIKELNRMRDEPVPAEELEAAKAFLRGQFGRSLESPNTVANFALNIERYNLPKDYYETYLSRLDAVTPEQIREAAKKYIRTDRMHILVVGNALEVAESLGEFGTVNYFDAFAEPAESPGYPIPEGVTAQTVLDNYLKAIGGDALAKVKDITLVSEATIQGFSLKNTQVYKLPNKVFQEQDMGPMGKVVMTYNGTTGRIVQGGQELPMDEEGLADLSQEAYFIPEASYAQMGAEVSLEGISKVMDKKAYMIKVTVNGSSETNYYDMESGLKVRTSTTEEGPQGEQTMNIDFTDYQEYSGLKLPGVISMPAGPMKLEFKLKEVKVNTNVPDSKFN